MVVRAAPKNGVVQLVALPDLLGILNSDEQFSYVRDNSGPPYILVHTFDTYPIKTPLFTTKINFFPL